jgi:hypothetical protein
MNKFRFGFLAVAGLLGATGIAHSQVSTLLAQLNFEAGNLVGTRQVRTNVPVVTSERARVGRYSLKSTLRAEGAKTIGNERNELEIEGSRAPMNTSVWYGFSVFLPSDYVADNVWELVTQWYPFADEDAEWGRQPTMALVTTKGVWSVENKSSTQVVTPINHSNIAGRGWSFGAYERNKWTDFVFNVRWSPSAEGFIKIWKDGKVVLDYKGPTSYNDKQGPFVKQGMYKGWHKMKIDQVTTRTAYFDEFKMAGPGGSYAAVAPGGGAESLRAKPAPPTGLAVQ